MGLFQFLDIVDDTEAETCELTQLIGLYMPYQWVEAANTLRESAVQGPDEKLFLEHDGQLYFGIYKDDPLILELNEQGLDLDITRITTIVRRDIPYPNIHICMASTNGTYVLLSAISGDEMLKTIYGVPLQRAVMAIHTDIPLL